MLSQKLVHFRQDPSGLLRGKIQDDLEPLKRRYREYRGVKFTWPIYDIIRYFRNREAARLYAGDESLRTANFIQQQVIDDLRKHGICVIHVSDLFPAEKLEQLRELAETYVQKPSTQQIVDNMRRGVRRNAPAGKEYLLKLMGDTPVLQRSDTFLQFSLDAKILTIVCGYLNMLTRLVAINLWLNVPSRGPEFLSQRWHRDPEDRQQVKLFLYLHDVNEQNGPFCYMRDTHHTGAFGGIFRQRINAGNYPEDGSLDGKLPRHLYQVCTGKAGTLIFCDTSGFHKGGYVAEDKRLLLNSVYTTNASAPVMIRQKYYSLANLNGQPLSRPAQYAIDHLEHVDK
jgi:ectoine hydroxylase-related dioxygenase (phytanoyl-CoA dioxygenase family)